MGIFFIIYPKPYSIYLRGIISAFGRSCGSSPSADNSPYLASWTRDRTGLKERNAPLPSFLWVAVMELTLRYHNLWVYSRKQSFIVLVQKFKSLSSNPEGNFCRTCLHLRKVGSMLVREHALVRLRQDQLMR